MKTTILDKTPLTPGCCEWCGNLCELEDVACCLSCEAQLNRLEAAQGFHIGHDLLHKVGRCNIDGNVDRRRKAKGVGAAVALYDESVKAEEQRAVGCTGI